jgi:hypothetical protein
LLKKLPETAAKIAGRFPQKNPPEKFESAEPKNRPEKSEKSKPLKTPQRIPAENPKKLSPGRFQKNSS